MANKFTEIGRSKGSFDDGRQKEEKVILGDQKIKCLPSNPFWSMLQKFLGIIALASALCFFMGSGMYRMLGSTSSIGIFITIQRLLRPMARPLLAVMVVTIGLMLVNWFVKLRAPRFDHWVRDIAKKRLSCEVIYFKGKHLFISYDVSLNKKDVMEFIREISDKSEHFTYYLDNIDIDGYTVSIEIAKKQEIPKRTTLDAKKDTIWNFIPLGEAVNNELRGITPIGWYLNDNTMNEQAIVCLPSTSFLVAGGTGSGKSVTENCIIGHITRHPEHIQGFLCDVKMVEFAGLDHYKGIHKVALTVAEVSELLEQVQRIMMNRFAFMKEHGVNNIYKLKADVDWFEIGSKRYQFDEIMQCTVNGQAQLLTVGQIYEAVMSGSEVDIDENCLMD